MARKPAFSTAAASPKDAAWDPIRNMLFKGNDPERYLEHFLNHVSELNQQNSHNSLRYAYNEALSYGEEDPQVDDVLVNDLLQTRPEAALEYMLQEGPRPELDWLMAMNSEAAFLYALFVLQKRFRDGEHAIAAWSDGALMYTKHILRGQRFLEAEDSLLADGADPHNAVHYLLLTDASISELETWIARSPQLSYMYAKHVLKGPFPQGELSIAQDAQYSFRYAREILKAPFLLAESCIKESPSTAYLYARFVLRAPSPFIEETLKHNASGILAAKYARHVLDGRFPAYERQLSKYMRSIRTDTQRKAATQALAYCEQLGKRCPTLETVFPICPDFSYAFTYNDLFIPGRYKELEAALVDTRYRDVDGKNMDRYLSGLRNKRMRTIGDKATQLALEYYHNPQSDTCKQLFATYGVSMQALQSVHIDQDDVHNNASLLHAMIQAHKQPAWEPEGESLDFTE